MVLVGVGDNNTKERRVGCLGSANWGEPYLIRIGNIKRQSDIHNETLTPRFNLNAGAADFLRPPMYANPHRNVSIPYPRVGGHCCFPDAAGNRYSPASYQNAAASPLTTRDWFRRNLDSTAINHLVKRPSMTVGRINIAALHWTY